MEIISKCKKVITYEYFTPPINDTAKISESLLNEKAFFSFILSGEEEHRIFKSLLEVAISMIENNDLLMEINIAKNKINLKFPTRTKPERDLYLRTCHMALLDIKSNFNV